LEAGRQDLRHVDLLEEVFSDLEEFIAVKNLEGLVAFSNLAGREEAVALAVAPGDLR
jgi:hypothetical protein